MGDQENGHAQVFLQSRKQIQNLRLNRHIQSRGRFVGDQQIRITRQGHGDHHPLLHPSRHFMRVLINPALWI